MCAKINKLLAKLGKAIIFARGIFVKRIYEKFLHQKLTTRITLLYQIAILNQDIKNLLAINKS